MKTVKIVLIVLAVLAVVGLIPICILAAIVIPQFTEASTEAELSSLCTDLQTLRSQITLYMIQHNDIPPTIANFEDQMTGYTDIDGVVQAAAGPNIYGPYIQKIPMNLFNDDDTVQNDGTIGNDSGGWEYDETTGAINADDNYDGDGDGILDHKDL